MDKISFIIPNNKNNFHEETLDILKLTKTEDKRKNNITDYIKIAPNVYRFNANIDENTNVISENIYVLYNNACQVKKENKLNAIIMFKKCVELIDNKTKKEIIYEIFVNLALLESETDGIIDDVDNYYKQALNIFSDRAEPYFYWSIYCNKIRRFEKAYDLLKEALLLSYDDAKNKYPGTQYSCIW